MINVGFGRKELTYLLIALQSYEEKLLDETGEFMEDAGNDLIFIQAMIRRVIEAKDSPVAPAGQD
jgi:hypothetical protein